MFEVKILVEDKKLADVMWLLDGKIAGEPKLRPIRGAKVTKHGTVKATQPAGKSLPGRVFELIKKKGVSKVDPDLMRGLVKEAGSKPSNYYYITQKLVKAGLLHKNAFGLYTVHHQQENE